MPKENDDDAEDLPQFRVGPAWSTELDHGRITSVLCL